MNFLFAFFQSIFAFFNLLFNILKPFHTLKTVNAPANQNPRNSLDINEKTTNFASS